MASEVTIAEFEDKEVKAFLKSMISKSGKVEKQDKQYVGLLSAIVFKDVITHFEQEKGSKGNWKKWSPTYQKHMQEIGRAGNKILQFSGRLRQNFKPTDYKTSAKGITWFNDAKTKSGFSYAAAHDSGGGKLPQRDFMWLSDKGLEQISLQTLQYLIDEGK
jgi:phage gpG-like protein